MPRFASRDLMITALAERDEWDAVGPCGDCTECTDKSDKPEQAHARDSDLAALFAQLETARGV